MNKYQIGAYAQEGEDLVLKEIFNYFEQRKPRDGGFYVDVGALHPFKLSNTALFYERDWNGINIDANPGSMELFNKYRKRDINLEFAISDKQETLKYYIFQNPALNSFDEKLSVSREEDIISIQEISTLTLEYILDTYLPKDQEIDFLNIDVEGFDLNVLKSNNWKKYKPKVIAIEILAMDINDVINSEIYHLLVDKGYKYSSKSIRTNFFIRDDIYKKRIL